MGIWGYKPFENDDAADWLTDFSEDPRLKMIESTFSKVLKTKGYLAVTEGSRALAAAAVLSGLCKQTKSMISEDVSEKLRMQIANLDRKKINELISRAKKALKRVGTDSKKSELLNMMKDGKLESKWKNSLLGIAANLEPTLLKVNSVSNSKITQGKKKIGSKKPTRSNVQKYKAGLIVAIPLSDQRKFAYAKVFNDFDLGVYSFLSNEIETPERVVKNKFLYFNAVTDRAIKKGNFIILGEEPFPDEESSWAPPMASGVFPGDLTATGVLFIAHKGEMRSVWHAPQEADGMDIRSFCQTPELFVEEVVDRLVNGNNRKYQFNVKKFK